MINISMYDIETHNLFHFDIMCLIYYKLMFSYLSTILILFVLLLTTITPYTEMAKRCVFKYNFFIKHYTLIYNRLVDDNK